MRHRLFISFVAIAAMLALGLPATAGDSSSPERVEPDGPTPWELADHDGGEFAQGLWFVEFHAEPRARGGSPADHANERAQFNAEARGEGVGVQAQRDFGALWNGMSAAIDPADVTVVAGFDSVAAVYPVALIERPEPEDISPELTTAITMTGADHAQIELGLTGEGLSVAVIDTGIDYNHPDLGGDGDLDNVILAGPDRSFDHPRISHGWDYVGDDFDASEPGAEPDPDPDPMDPHGHGTHVAGIVGADAADEDGVTGVAPGVTFGAYKVFGATGPTTADVIVEALEDAFEDGMDVVNMSIGATFVWGQDYPTTATSNELTAQGVVVVNSAGNDGGLGMWSLSAPANAHDIISVASADNLFFEAMVFEIEQLDDPIPFLELDGAELPPMEGESEEVAWIGRACEPDDFFEGEPDELLDDPEGMVALIVRGECAFATKYTRAAEAGATGVVIFNNEPGMFAGTIFDDGVEGVWGATISDAAGESLVELIEDPDETLVLGFTEETETMANPTGGLASGFSSFGQDVELAFGPSIMAPGGLINSTWPGNSYATISGTSMSAPHVAGAVALLLEVVPDLDPFEVRDRLQNTAEPALWSLAPGAGFLEHTVKQGAGMLRIDRAVTAEQHVVPGQVAVEDAPSVTTTLTVTNDADVEVTYEVGHVGALGASVNTFDPIALLPGGVVEATETVTVAAGGTADVEVTITAPGFGLPNHQYGGYITLTPDEETLETDGTVSSLRVPYSGYDGDYQELPLFGYFIWPFGEPLQFIEQLPHLSRIIYDEDALIEDFEPVEEGHVYTLRDGDFPVVELFFGHFPQEMRVHAHDQDRNRSYHLGTFEHLPRSPSPEDFLAFTWSGMVEAGESVQARTIPSGTYTIEVEALRALGDADDPDHWDTWESFEVRIDTRRGGPRDVPGPPPGRGPGGGGPNGTGGAMPN